MKLVLQRVANAAVYIEGQTVARISQGLLIFFGVEKNDNSDKVNYLADKALTLRIFQDEKATQILFVKKPTPCQTKDTNQDTAEHAVIIVVVHLQKQKL